MPGQYDETRKFYQSPQWRKLRKFIIESRFGICNRCGAPGTEVHHKVPITPRNVNDLSVSMNPDNLELLCKTCHDRERMKHFAIRQDVYFDAEGNMHPRSR